MITSTITRMPTKSPKANNSNEDSAPALRQEVDHTDMCEWQADSIEQGG